MASPNDNKIDLEVVVSGAPVAVTVNPKQKADQVVREALRDSGNEGRPIEDWELTTENGTLVDLGARIEDLGFADGTRLFLSPKVSGGG